MGREKKRLLIVCGSNSDFTAEIIAKKLSVILDEMKIEATVDCHQGTQLVEEEKYDLIVSTVEDFSAEKTPVISGLPLITGIHRERFLDELSLFFTS